MKVSMIDVSTFPAQQIKGWRPLVVPKAEIDREIERLADLPRPENGIRAVRIVHPESTGPGRALSPGIDVTINVLKPGEETSPIRHNSSSVSICIKGRGSARIGSKQFSLERYDVWNTPSMHPYVYRNDGDDLFVRLTYSNGALLEDLRIHHVEHMGAGGFAVANAPHMTAKLDRLNQARDRSKGRPIGNSGAQVLTIEHVIAPDFVPNFALHWPWKDIRPLLAGSDDRPVGRNGVIVLHNPATGRTVGTSHNFIAAMGYMQPGVVDKRHRHSSSAINYSFEGSGFITQADGDELVWGDGDIAYTAPGWSAHVNESRDRPGGFAMTIQDHPLQIATESLLWQEPGNDTIILLGSQEGFERVDHGTVVSGG